VGDVSAALEELKSKLLEARTKRVRPHLDDKILTSWNGLMISAFAKGGAVLEEPRYAEAARRSAEFVIERLYDAANGTLLRRYRAGEAAIPGFLDDYAFFAQGLLDLYEAQFDLRHLQLAIALTDKQMRLFEDREAGAFFSTAEGDNQLVLRVKEDYDGAEPSGNSIAVANLLRLAQITNSDRYRQSAARSFSALGSRLSTVPAAVPQLMAACEFVIGGPREIILAGALQSAEMETMLRELYRRFVPHKVVLLVDSSEAKQVLMRDIPSIESMPPIEGRATAYVCRDYACQLPVTEPDKFVELLQY
jgi:uncharacterized protein YyaL (SSP411 family)